MSYKTDHWGVKRSWNEDYDFGDFKPEYTYPEERRMIENIVDLVEENHDTDWDGVPNRLDCEPLNPHKQGLLLRYAGRDDYSRKYYKHAPRVKQRSERIHRIQRQRIQRVRVRKKTAPQKIKEDEKKQIQPRAKPKFVQRKVSSYATSTRTPWKRR